MPITLTPNFPGNLVGPGVSIQLNSTHSDAVSTPTNWAIQIYADADKTAYITQSFFGGGLPSSGAGGVILGSKNTQSLLGHGTAVEGGTVYWTAQMYDSHFVQLDTGTGTSTWTNANIGVQNMLLALEASGGLTSGQAAQLTDINTDTNAITAHWDTYLSTTLPSLQDFLNTILSASTALITGAGGAVSKTIGEILSGKLLDLLTTTSLTDGETCDPVDQLVSGAGLYGVVVNCTTVPDYYAFTAPGETWCPRDLAVLEVVRGGAVLLRHGIHTRTHEVYPLPGIPAVTLELDVPVIPPDYRFKVWWGAGVCGEVLLLELP